MQPGSQALNQTMADDAHEMPIRPPESPLAMPRQSLGEAPKVKKPGGVLHPGGLLVLVGSTLATTGAGIEMFGVLNVSGMTIFEYVVMVLFLANFAWVCAACVTAIVGFFTLLTARSGRKADEPLTPPAGKTALVFPVYNEDVARAFGGAEAIWEDLVRKGVSGSFELFLLSDTTNADIALREEAAILDIRRRRPNEAIFYRRRTINRERKAGNVKDFIQRWGGRYDYMVVLDADSLMTAGSIVELARRMDAAPDTALIQTVPTIIGARTGFARLQQFAANTYGRLFVAGLAWFSGPAGNYWGHNAIIRVKPFADHAGLPHLPGKAPMGGPILSHDFVEAALLRRAGWRITIAADIGGSHEETPPTIIDLAVRDRRWCQGNLQHISVMTSKGLDWMSRAHMGIGVMGYASAMLWMALIVAGLGLSLQGHFIRPDYFPNRSPFPVWPVIDDARAFRLSIGTLAVVLAPKWLTLVLWAGGRLPGFDKRRWHFAPSVIAETLASAAAAPLLMFNQSLAVISALSGKDVGWSAQMRDGGVLSLKDAVRAHAPHMIFGFSLMAFSFAISPVFAAWMSPAGLSLVCAGPIAWLMARPAQTGRAPVLLRTPEEEAPPAILLDARRIQGELSSVTSPRVEELASMTMGSAVVGASVRTALIDDHWDLGPADIHPPTAYLLARMERAPDREHLLKTLTPEERLVLVNRPDLLADVRRMRA